MYPLMLLGAVALLVATPWVGSRVQHRIWRPLPPIGGGKVIPFRPRRDISVDDVKVQG